MDWTLQRKAHNEYELVLAVVGDQSVKLGTFDAYPSFAEITKAIQEYDHERAMQNLYDDMTRKVRKLPN